MPSAWLTRAQGTASVAGRTAGGCGRPSHHMNACTGAVGSGAPGLGSGQGPWGPGQGPWGPGQGPWGLGRDPGAWAGTLGRDPGAWAGILGPGLGGRPPPDDGASRQGTLPSHGQHSRAPGRTAPCMRATTLPRPHAPPRCQVLRWLPLPPPARQPAEAGRVRRRRTAPGRAAGRAAAGRPLLQCGPAQTATGWGPRPATPRRPRRRAGSVCRSAACWGCRRPCRSTTAVRWAHCTPGQRVQRRQEAPLGGHAGKRIAAHAHARRRAPNCAQPRPWSAQDACWSGTMCTVKRLRAACAHNTHAVNPQIAGACATAQTGVSSSIYNI